MIKQVRFSKSVKFFEKGFCERWDVKPYSDPNKPCLFVGLYRREDLEAINNHKSNKIIVITGKDRGILKYINPDNVVVLDIIDGVNDTYKHKCKFSKARFQLKDYSTFKPNPLGNKIYTYLGNENGKYIMGYEEIMMIQKRIPFEIIHGLQGHSMEYVKQQYYDECFVNIKISLTGGFTSATELAYMGRYTISNAKSPFMKGYNNIDDIIKIIDEESKKIGSIQQSLVGDFFNMDKEWKLLKTWF